VSAVREDDNDGYVGFDDEDGEYFQINPKELVWMMVPTPWLNEGQELNISEAEG
jgi:hypothetical protein